LNRLRSIDEQSPGYFIKGGNETNLDGLDKDEVLKMINQQVDGFDSDEDNIFT
jgi:hypothetical protein